MLCSTLILRILALTRKELLAILKDPRSRFSLLVPPMIQCLIFGYAATFDLNDVPYAVLDQTAALRPVTCWPRLDGSGVFRRVANLDRAAEMPTLSMSGVPYSSIQIRRDFERRLLGGPAGRRAGDRRWAQLQHRRHGLGYVGAVVERSTPTGERTHGQGGAADPGHHAGLVQPESRDALEHDPGPDRHAHACCRRCC